MKFVKSLLIILVVLAMAISVNAADLRWDASTGDVEGYNIYFTDGTTVFNYNAGTALEVLDIDNALNLHRGTTYIFTATAYNEAGESPESDSAEYTTADAYVPPPNSIPVVQGQPTVLTLILSLP